HHLEIVQVDVRPAEGGQVLVMEADHMAVAALTENGLAQNVGAGLVALFAGHVTSKSESPPWAPAAAAGRRNSAELLRLLIRLGFFLSYMGGKKCEFKLHFFPL